MNSARGLIYLIMFCAFLGAVKDETTGISKEFMEGRHSIGPIFIPVAGVMTSIPILSKFIGGCLGLIFVKYLSVPAIQRVKN